MAKKQSRRSISVKGRTYARLDNAHASGKIGRSISGYLETIIAEKLDALGVPDVDPTHMFDLGRKTALCGASERIEANIAAVTCPTCKAKHARNAKSEPEIVSQHFTF